MKRLLLRSIVLAAAALVLQLGTVPPALAAAGQEQGSANGQPFQTLREEIDLLNAELDDAVAFLQQQIDDLVASQAEQDQVIAALQAAVAALAERVAQNEADIATLEALHEMQDQLIAALEGRLTDLEARVVANESDIAALILADQVMQQMIDAIKQDIVVLNQLIAANAADIAALQAQVASLQASLAALQTQLAAKQDRVLGVCAPGSSIRVINPDGTVVCEPDDVGAGVGSLSRTSVFASFVTIPSSIILRRSVSSTATCPSTYQVTGGGFQVFDGNLGVGQVDESNPSGNGWFARAVADSVGERRFRAVAQCMRVQ